MRAREEIEDDDHRGANSLVNPSGKLIELGILQLEVSLDIRDQLVELNANLRGVMRRMEGDFNS